MSEKQPLHTLNYALALGLTSSIAIITLGIGSMVFNWGEGIVVLIAQCYIGYEPSIKGSLIGACWAFVDGFIAGFFISWIYNRFLKLTNS